MNKYHYCIANIIAYVHFLHWKDLCEDMMYRFTQEIPKALKQLDVNFDEQEFIKHMNSKFDKLCQRVAKYEKD